MALSRTDIGSQTATSASTCTKASVTLNTGDLLVVCVAAARYPNVNEVTGVTWNSISLTKAVEATVEGEGSSEWQHASIWYLKIASGATGSIVATAGSSNTSIILQAFSYTGHDTTTPIGNTSSTRQNASSAVDPSLTLTTVSGDEVVDCLSFYSEFGYTATVGAGQTQKLNTSDGSFASVGVSVKAASGTSVGMSWTRSSNSVGFQYCAATVTATAGGGGGGTGPFPHFTRRTLRGGMLFPGGGLL